MTSPRRQIVDPSVAGYYHCVSRCVRRAFLCGEDEYTGRCYEHRKAWVEDPLLALAGAFCPTRCLSAPTRFSSSRCSAVRGFTIGTRSPRPEPPLDPRPATAGSAARACARCSIVAARAGRWIGSGRAVVRGAPSARAVAGCVDRAVGFIGTGPAAGSRPVAVRWTLRRAVPIGGPSSRIAAPQAAPAAGIARMCMGEACRMLSGPRGAVAFLPGAARATNLE